MLRAAAPDLHRPEFRSAVVSGAAGREEELLAAIAGGALDSSAESTQRLVSDIAGILRSAREPPPPAAGDRSPVAVGSRLYRSHCLWCHQSDGEGMPPVYPPLKGSPAVRGDPAMLARILLQGLEGPLESDGIVYRGVMPIAPLASDDEFAALMT
ncbi:MAG: c-type cytochrome, partial [bacterium]